MFSWILFFIIVASLSIGAVIIGRKFPALKVVNPQASPVFQQMAVKRKLLEDRLQRQVKNLGAKAYVQLKPLMARAVFYLRQGYQKLVNLEEQYRHRVWRSGFQDKVSQEQKINELSSRAAGLLEKENYDEAEKQFIEVLTLDQRNVEAYRGLGRLYLLKKDFTQAKETFEFLLKLNQRDPFIYRSLGAIAADRGDLKSAENEYLKSLELDSAESGTYLDLAWVYLNLEEPSRAFAILNKAAALEPKNPKILDFLIEVCIILQDKVAARKFLRQLTDANPENQKLSEFREKINKL